jgi:hypothetical protein
MIEFQPTDEQAARLVQRQRLAELCETIAEKTGNPFVKEGTCYTPRQLAFHATGSSGSGAPQR